MKCAIVLIARYENNYIKEFIDYHTRIGFDRFYIYDNSEYPEEPLESVLKDYNNIIIIKFPGETKQREAYIHYKSNILPYTDDDWIAYIDCDEYIVPKKHLTIKKFLEEYNHIDSIGLNWKIFGTSGHIEEPEGGIIKNYTKSAFNKHIKTLISRKELLRLNVPPLVCVHNIGYVAKDLDNKLIEGPFNNKDYTDIICINHYYTKAYNSLQKKFTVNPPDGGIRIGKDFRVMLKEVVEVNQEDDYDIINLIKKLKEI